MVVWKSRAQEALLDHLPWSCLHASLVSLQPPKKEEIIGPRGFSPKK